MEQANWQRRRDILICIICAGIIVVAAWTLINQFIDAILLLLLSMAVAFLITPAVNALERLKIPRVLGALLTYIVVLAVIGGVGYALIFALINQVQQFSNTVVNFVVYILPNNLISVYNFLVQQGIPENNISTALNQIQLQVQSFASAAATNALNILVLISNLFVNIVVVLVMSFYLTVDGRRIRNRIMNAIPRRIHSHALLFEDALNRVVGNYIRGQLTLAVIIGIMVTLVCMVTGLGQFALIFGVLGFLFETIPMVGPLLASISPILASLLMPDPFPRTIWIVVCFVVIQMLESNVLGPRIVGHAVGLHPVASIMALLVFARLFGTAFGAFGGAVGALIATPIVAAGWVVLVSIYRSMRGETADQILAHRRASWSIGRSTVPMALKLRRARRLGARPPSFTARDQVAEQAKEKAEEALVPQSREVPQRADDPSETAE